MNAIFYKEWIKTRWYLLLALLVTLGFAGYSMLRINRVASMKVTLHLPYPQLRMINLMLLYGLVVLLICFAANYVLMTVYMQGVLAPELYSRILLTALPWYLAGIAAYLLISWICLEPTWKRRVLNLVISVLLLRIFFLAPAPEAYNAFLPWLAIYTLLTASLSWLSIARFKAGEQD